MTIDEQAEPATDAAIVSAPGRLERLVCWYMARAAGYSNCHFIIELLVLSFALKIIGVIPLFLLPDAASKIDQVPEDMPWAFFVFSALILSPVIETVVFQWFLIWLTSFFTVKRIWRIAVPTLVFALPHAGYGLAAAWAVLFPGAVFAFSFMVKRQESRWAAFWMTTLIHAGHNAVVLPLLLLAEGVG